MAKVGIISTVKAPLPQLRLFVNYHLNIGVDCIVLFFDDPEDEGVDSFSQYKQVSTIKCSSDYWLEKAGGRPDSIEERQITNVNEGVTTLTSQNYDWLIHIDSDELIHPLKQLKQVLSNSNAHAVKFSLLEAVPDREKYDHLFQPKMFKSEPNRYQIRLAKLLQCSDTFFENEFFRGHVASKMAVKISGDIKRYEIHGAEKEGSNLVVENTRLLQLLHYDCIGIDDWKLKWDRRIDGSGKAVNMRNNRSRQLSLYKKAKNEGQRQLSSLYRGLYFIPLRERVILYLLGMLRRVNLDHELFEHENVEIKHSMQPKADSTAD